MKVTVGVDVAAVLYLEPTPSAFHRDLPIDVGRADGDATLIEDGHLPARSGLAERAGAHGVAGEAGVIHEDDADLGAAVHAARRDLQGAIDEFERARMLVLAE